MARHQPAAADKDKDCRGQKACEPMQDFPGQSKIAHLNFKA
jgi:hypothetical protein